MKVESNVKSLHKVLSKNKVTLSDPIASKQLKKKGA